MKRIDAFLDRVFDTIANNSAALGARVLMDANALDRSDSIALTRSGLSSANGSCRLIKARDAWIAVNLPRSADLDDVPALLEEAPSDDPWQTLTCSAPSFTADQLVHRAELLGLAIAKIGETPSPASPCAASLAPAKMRRHLRVVDLSALWAGPLCGSVFAQMGAEVVKLESAERPDTTAQAAPLHDHRLNGAKTREKLSLATDAGRAELLDHVAHADVLITSARAGTLQNLGLARERVLGANPSLLWIAITGHGWDNHRIAFGDDAAASGNLLTWNDDTPNFIGDAIADPLTGLAAAAAALKALAAGNAGFIDAPLARVAAYVEARA